MSALSMRGGIFTRSLKLLHSMLSSTPAVHFRSEKVVTFTDHMDLPLTGWSDLSEWPELDSLASKGALIIGVNLEMEVEPRDDKTKKALESFRNKFVEQNCSKDDEIRHAMYKDTQFIHHASSELG